MEWVAQVISSPMGGDLVFSILCLWPLVRTFRRAGLSPAWAGLVLVPVIGIAVVLAPLAIKKWPAVQPGGVAHPQFAATATRDGD